MISHFERQESVKLSVGPSWTAVIHLVVATLKPSSSVVSSMCKYTTFQSQFSHLLLKVKHLDKVLIRKRGSVITTTRCITYFAEPCFIAQRKHSGGRLFRT